MYCSHINAACVEIEDKFAGIFPKLTIYIHMKSVFLLKINDNF